MEVVSGIQEKLPLGLYKSVARYRHDVFIENLGWGLPTSNGIELDQFDRYDTVYVIARDTEDDRIIGCARLLPTTRPYLLSEIFPNLLGGSEPPHSPDIWELSRFAATDFHMSDSRMDGKISSPLAVKLLKESIACAAKLGAKQLITVSPKGVERLLRREGFSVRRVGSPIVVDANPIVAFLIQVDDPCSDN